ncbi:hypothetical protein BDN72DRAFT_918335, partial [Pluteus cervinus]
LPAEILSEIFAIVQEYLKVKKIEDPLTPPFPALQKWLPITHVSQRWRQVALSCSQLWRDIDTDDLPGRAIPTFLERSGETGLLVNFGDRWMLDDDPTSVLAEILAQNSRIQRLTVTGDLSLVHILPYFTYRPAPKLKELFLDGQEADIPDDIYQGITPQLENLSISGCRFNPDAPLSSYP